MGERRPLVLMLLPPGVPFGDDWARAARTVADVVTLAPVRRLAWPRHRALPFLAREPLSGIDYELALPRLRPDRLLRPVQDGLGLRRLVAAIGEISEQHGPVDLVHTHYYPNARLLPAVHQRLGLPYVHTEHSTRLTGASPHPRKQLTPAVHRAASAVFRDAACVVAVSHYLRDCLVRQAFPGRFEVIGNPLDVDAFRAVRPRPANGEVVRAVSVGRLEPDKGFDIVLAALAIAHRTEPRLRLDIVGDGPDRAELSAQAERLGLAEHVRFSGRLTRAEIAERLWDAHLYLAGSRMETFGVAVAEAMAAGVPVAAAGAGSLPEIIGDQGGIVVPPDDPDALATAMVALARDGAGFPPDQVAGPVRRCFSFEAVGARLLHVYEAARRP